MKEKNCYEVKVLTLNDILKAVCEMSLNSILYAKVRFCFLYVN